MVLLVAAFSSACGPGSESATAPKTARPPDEIHVLVLGDAAAAAEKAAAERFNKASAVKIVIDIGSTTGVDYNAALHDSIDKGTAPDIFMSWGAAGIRPLVQKGALLPLDDFIKSDPPLRDSFIPSVFKEQVIDGVTYGIPVRGVAPEFLFYNKRVLRDAGLKPAATLDELTLHVALLKGRGITPIGVAGADKWPQLIWFQYLYSRVVGNDSVARALAGDDEVWASNRSRVALQMIRELVDFGAFGTGYDSVKYGADGSAALLREGKTAYELQGTWHFATTAEKDQAFAEKDLGWVPFPSVANGEGQPGEIVGNLSNFYNVLRGTRYPDTVRDFLRQLYNREFLAEQIRLGNLPPANNAGELVRADQELKPINKSYLGFIIDLVAAAPNFQLSWDQAVPADKLTVVQDATAAFFNDTIDANAFIAAMQEITP